MSTAELAIESALEFPWIGILLNITFLVWLMKFRMFNSLIDKNTRKESEWMINLWSLLEKSGYFSWMLNSFS